MVQGDRAGGEDRSDGGEGEDRLHQGRRSLAAVVAAAAVAEPVIRSSAAAVARGDDLADAAAPVASAVDAEDGVEVVQLQLQLQGASCEAAVAPEELREVVLQVVLLRRS